MFLECETRDAEIFYTTNGSYPAECNLELMVRICGHTREYALSVCLFFIIVKSASQCWILSLLRDGGA